MEDHMGNRIVQSAMAGAFLLLLSAALSFSQPATISAGSNQLINWEKSHSAQLSGGVSSDKAKVQWTCPQKPDVRFKDASRPATEVTFPRPGYYLLVLSQKGPGKDSARSSVVVNVCASHSYKERLTDLISLMTVDEKIRQLTNESDSIPRLGIRNYNYWSEALHGVLGYQATSFPQAVGMGSTWDPDLIHRVGTAISEEARALNVIEGKGLTYWSPTINIARDPRWGRNEGVIQRRPLSPLSYGCRICQRYAGGGPLLSKDRLYSKALHGKQRGGTPPYRVL